MTARHPFGEYVIIAYESPEGIKTKGPRAW
jgi:hypothetical protein